MALDEIVKTISNINEMTQSNASASEEMSAGADMTKKSSELLKDKVEYFKV